MADERTRVLFRYDETEHPLLDTWLSNQQNKNRSIVFALEQVIAQTGETNDIIAQTLKQATLNKQPKAGDEA